MAPEDYWAAKEEILNRVPANFHDWLVNVAWEAALKVGTDTTYHQISLDNLDELVKGLQLCLPGGDLLIIDRVPFDKCQVLWAGAGKLFICPPCIRLLCSGF
ncbi:MAG: hypothetical protein V3T30_04425, partial [Thermodesulfobacteriota bacterium]